MLHLDGIDLTALPLEERKRQLESLLPVGDSVLRYSQHFDVDGPTLLARACELGAEGIVSKRRTDRYRPGRGNAWLKAKCVQRAQFVVGGFTEPEGSRAGIGALLLGYYDEAGALRYAGKVGTGVGFTADFLRELRTGLDTIQQETCPFAKRPPADASRNARWVSPALVCEVSFTEWTNDGTLRHPSFQGFRPDTRAVDVVRKQSNPRHAPD